MGLDEYETRTWAGCAAHHVALCLLGGAFLLSLQQAWGEKDAPDHEAAGLPGGAGIVAQGTVGPAELLRWLEETQDSNLNGPSAPMPSAAPHFVPPRTFLLDPIIPTVVVILAVLALIHRRTACRRPAEETKGCASESGIMVL